uniref:Vezatin domain-containing protein n=1 Tax=Parastrongyloides trichosuri TaxID=131310 RepID=A0A0N4Z9H2_PARTI
MLVNCLINILDNYFRRNLLNTISRSLVNDNLIDDADKEAICEKIIEVGEWNENYELSRKSIKHLFRNNDFNISITFFLIIIISIGCYFNNFIGILIFVNFIIAVLCIPLTLYFDFKKNVEKFYDLVEKNKELIKDKYFKLLKRRETLLFTYKSSELKNLSNKKLRISCLTGLRRLVWFLIKKNKEDFVNQTNDKVMMIDLVNENMLELCSGKDKDMEINDEHLDMMSLSALLQFLSLCESEFLRFFFFEIFEVVMSKIKTDNVWKYWWNLWTVISIIKQVNNTYREVYIIMNNLYKDVRKFEECKKENRKVINVIKDNNKCTRTIIHDTIGLIVDEISNLKDEEIIGNKVLLEMTKNLHTILMKPIEKKVEKTVERNEETNIMSECPPMIPETPPEPTYEVYENIPSNDNKYIDDVKETLEFDQEVMTYHKMLLNELERPLQEKRKIHEELELNILAKKRGVTVEELKEILDIEKNVEKNEEKNELKSIKQIEELSPMRRENEILLMNELKLQFFNQNFNNSETVFGGDDE